MLNYRLKKVGVKQKANFLNIFINYAMVDLIEIKEPTTN